MQDVEIIIKDGASQDATLSLLQERQTRLPNIQVYSAPDNGIYDAWNKALGHISGQWVLFLGADDRLVTKDSLQQAIGLLCALPEDALYMATPVVETPNAHAIITVDAAHMLCPSQCLAQDIPQGMVLPHQGLFHRATLFEGRRFDDSFRIAGDYDFLARTWTLGKVVIRDTPLVCMAAGGVSSALESMWRGEWEQLRISRRHFPHALPWKLGLRLVRSLICAGIAHTLGKKTAARFANTVRKMLGRSPLWGQDKQL